MNLVNLAIADLSGAETFPLDAIMTLRQKWDEARAPLLACLEAYASGEDRSDENAEKVFFGLHILAEKREAAAFAPLVAVAMQGAPLYDMIGDATTETLPNLFVSLYDGNLDLLKKLVETAEADEWARVAAMECFCWLASNGDISLDSVREQFASWFETLQPRAADPVWFGWQGCVALLGLVELEPQAVRLFRQGLVDKDVLTFYDFQGDLRAFRAADNPRLALTDRCVGPVEDALETLAV